ncbi:MAG: superoxide dismutase [Elusimicrobia bacterium]|nr:superoxide dismutase [Elusimicrobiota bacterium]
MTDAKKILFLAAAAALIAGSSLAAEPSALTQPVATPAVTAFTQPPLPYAPAALAPFISAEVLQYHYASHQKGALDTLNKLVTGKSEAGRALEEIIKTASPGPLFNAAAQVWNHTFYWNSLKPNGGGEPSGALAEAIKRDFGSYAQFREQFAKAATSLFGSGWAWLVLENGKLKIVQTSNADNPMCHGQTALLVLDVWEHAYYIDYRNGRAKYVDAAIDHLINWDFASANLARSVKQP